MLKSLRFEEEKTFCWLSDESNYIWNQWMQDILQVFSWQIKKYKKYFSVQHFQDGGECCWTCVLCREEQYLYNETACKSCHRGWWPNINKTGDSNNKKEQTATTTITTSTTKTKSQMGRLAGDPIFIFNLWKPIIFQKILNSK